MKNFLLYLSVLCISNVLFAQQPANDECANAETINVITASETTVNFSTTNAELNNEVGCEADSPDDYVDVWYEFNMPVTGNVYINGVISWNRFAVYDACGSSEITCFQGSGFITDLIEGETYQLRVFRTESLAASSFQSFGIQAIEKPDNDECADAEILNVTTSTTNINFDVGGADINNEEGCDGSTVDNYADIWYDFTMPVTGNIFVDGVTTWNRFAIYDTCGGTEIECFQASSLITDLIQGNNYRLRVYRTESLANSSFQSFGIRAIEKPNNDECVDTESLNLTTSTTNVNFNVGGADINNEVGCGGSTADNYVDIWYDFTMPVTGNIFVDGVTTWNKFAIYDACGGTEIACFEASSLITSLIESNTYRLRVFRTESLANNSFQSFGIRAIAKPDNDECTDAESLTVSTSSSTAVSFDVGGADINNEMGCSGSTAENYVDIWYDFTMPVTGNIFVDGVTTWNNFAIYDACGGTEIACFEASSLITNLTQGNTYRIRVFRTESLADNSFQSFTIQAFEVIPNDDCADAENIDLTSGQVEVDFSISGANLNNEEGCEGSALLSYADVWYEFEMPFSGDLYIDGIISWNQFAIYDACGGNELYCFNNQNLIQGLDAGDYVLRVFRTESLADNGLQNFSIQAFENSTNCAGISIWNGVEWNNGLPDATTKAITNDDFTLSSEIEWCELEVADGTYTIEQDAKLILNETVNSLTVKSTGKLKVEGILDVAGSIENNGDLVFISNATTTGQLDELSSGASITGEVEVQRFVPAGDNLANISNNVGRAFRFLTSTVTTSSTIRYNWQQGGLNPGNAGYEDNVGTHITGSTTGANGFDATSTGNPSMFTFDNATPQDWVALPGTDGSNTLKAGRAYLAIIRGDRSINLTINDPNATNTTLRATGQLLTGQVDYAMKVDGMATTASHFSFVANPYQAVVNYVNVGRINLTDLLYVWDASINTRGGYVTVDFSDTSDIFNNVTSSDASNFLAPGQSFFVQNDGTGNGALTFNEDDKATSATQVSVFSTNTNFTIQSSLYKTSDLQNGNSVSDGLVLVFNDNYTTPADYEDAVKFTNPDENYAIINNGLRSIDKQAMPAIGHEIDLSISNYRESNYSLTFDIENNPEDLGVFLNDNYLDSQAELTNDFVYDFSVDENIPESIATDRFSLSFDSTTLGVDENVFGDGFSLYPNPTQDGRFSIKTNNLNNDEVSVKLYSILGQEVFSKTLIAENNGEIDVNASSLSAGVYMVELMQNEQKFFSKLIVE